MSEKIEADHFPEIADNGKGFHRLELLGIDEQLADPGQRRELFSSMSNEDFQRMFGYVNSITRGESISYDYEDGQLPLHPTPKLEDKSRLMERTYDAVREIAQDESLDERTALRRAGLTMAGAINLIHPKKNGNGRTARALHYLIEFGTERGKDAFGDEMYAVVGKLPVYDTDNRDALRDSPPSQMERSLMQFASAHVSEEMSETMDDRDWAGVCVVSFLDMMKGNVVVPIDEKVSINRGKREDGSQIIERIEPGTMDGVELYEATYLASSTIPNRKPDDVPFGAKRVVAEKHVVDPDKTISISMDIVS